MQAGKRLPVPAIIKPKPKCILFKTDRETAATDSIGELGQCLPMALIDGHHGPMTTGRESEVLSMAISLSRLVPDTDRCLSLRRFSYRCQS